MKKLLLPNEFLPQKIFMQEALRLAKQAGQQGEVPVGAVIVKGEKIVGRGRNMREKKASALSHAEIEAIDSACKKLGKWRLEGCTMYVTLSPCPMCAGAIIAAKLDRVVFGADDDKGEQALDLLRPRLGGLRLYRNFMQSECAELLNQFFKKLR